MANVTVYDVCSTLKTLKRLENYAHRHMQNVPISEANESVRDARDLLKDNVNNFQRMNVIDLTPDTTDLEERRNRILSELQDNEMELDEELAKKKKNRDSWTVKYCKRRIEELQSRLDQIDEKLYG